MKLNPLANIQGIERQARGRYNLNGKSVQIKVSELGQVQVRMGATWEAIQNYLQIGVARLIEATLDDLSSSDLDSSGQKAKSKKKSKGKSKPKGTPEVDLDLDMD